MSSDFLLDSSNPVITINQAILSFKINKQKISSQLNSFPDNKLIPISQNEVLITNITSSFVAYRTRITRKKYYAVEPTHLVIPPNKNIKVKIIFYFNPKEKFPPEGHKFRFEGIIIPNNMKNKDAKEIFDELSANKKEVKGNSIRKVVEFIYDNNYDFDFSSIENIKDDLSRSSNSINSIISSKESIYSNALSKSTERRSKLALKSNKKTKLRAIKENENLDPEKLKEEYERLQIEYDKNVKEFNSIKEKINIFTSKNKFRYVVPDVQSSRLSNKNLAILFGIAFFLGFYLTK
jgi:hypothetical protein